MIHRQPGLHARAYLRRGDGERKASKSPSAKWSWKRDRCFAGARYDDERDQSGEFCGVAPFRQFRNMIRPDQIEEPCLRKAPCVIADRFNRIRGAATVQFLFVNFTPRMACKRKPQHPKTLVCRRRHAVGLEWRLRRGDEEQARESQFFPRRLGHQQMTEVNRIKRAAEQANVLFKVQSSRFRVERTMSYSTSEH